MTPHHISKFQKIIWDYYAQNKRILPWRNIENPYQVFVSEIMLQQTQVARVLKKYPEFLEHFPTFEKLAQSSTKDLLSIWSGMGYNRRALFMRSAAIHVVKNHQGILPRSPVFLQTLPGVGKATAGSLAAFAYNIPTVFIETNIRRVFIHHFFADRDEVHDKDIYPFVESTVDRENPRDWYYALMDYGVMLAKNFENANKRSRHYSVQSRFEGSDRQIRGAIIRELTKKESLTIHDFPEFIVKDEERVNRILNQMKSEGFIQEKNGKYEIKS